MKRQAQRSQPRCSCVVCHEHPRSVLAKEHRAINRLVVSLDEKNRRQLAGLLAWQWGRGGIAGLAEITGLSRSTIRRGREEVQRVERRSQRGRVRKVGAGRPRVEKNTPIWSRPCAKR